MIKRRDISEAGEADIVTNSGDIAGCQFGQRC